MMVLGGERLNKSYLDADLIFFLWLSTGSIKKTRKFLIEKGFRNPFQEKQPSEMGCWYAAKRSEHYKKYMQLRLDKKAGAPTRAELARAEEYIKKNLPVELAKNQELVRIHRTGK